MTEDVLLVRFFPLSLSGLAFSWFASLPPNSINSWANLENQFHRYFFTGITEMAPSNLMALKQRSGESVANYIQRFRDVRSRCYSLVLTDRQLANMAWFRLQPTLKERLLSNDFDSLSHLAQVAMNYENQFAQSKSRSVNQINRSLSESESDDDVNLAEWTRNKKPVGCPWVKKGYS